MLYRSEAAVRGCPGGVQDAVRCSAAVYVPGTHSVVHLPRLRRSAEVVDQPANQLAPMPRRMGRTTHAPATLPARMYTYQKSMEPFPFKSAGSLRTSLRRCGPCWLRSDGSTTLGYPKGLDKQSISTNAGDETFGAAPGHSTVEL